MTRKTITAVAAAVALLPGLLTACSGGAPSDGSTTGNGSSGSGVSLSSCMRDRGYDMSEPGSNSGVQTLAAPDGVDGEQWDTDLQECMGDQGAGEGFQAAKPAGTPEQRKQAAECIRDSGFSDYPDGDAAMQSYRPDDEQAFQDASSKCFDQAFGAGSEPKDGTE
ncbi:hypothetical protein [Curtobacterium sp. VKM Ac-2884]|uniref:hypothetical protein n=1 Tax=Curtobacterium sp. VKM Ac-2884 TaxID=2783818 RepID=UPI00188BB3BC|nr:hypothetical protein [Curtobacterium sp. VKM Ac-2884]MBF4605118.1 hypothetical protein [Curtobacterium sp. VKM Ac-2884]